MNAINHRTQIPQKFLDGVIYPIPPAFTPDDELDCDAVRRYLSYLYENGAKIILVTAGTSRFNLLDDAELKRFNAACLEFPGVKILGLPPLPTKLVEDWLDCINCRQSSEPPDGVILLYPDRYYDDDSIRDYFYHAADISSVPIIVHGMFMRNAVSGGMYEFTLDLIAKLKEHTNILGIKEESISFESAYRASRSADDSFLVFSAGGSCRRFLLTHPAGAQNFLGGIGNIYPQIEEAFYSAMKDGRRQTAYKIVRRYEDPLFETFGPIGWHRALQIALDVKDLLPSANRKPFAVAQQSHVTAVRQVLNLIESRLDLEGLD